MQRPTVTGPDHQGQDPDRDLRDVNWVEADRMDGMARATVNREEFGMRTPSVLSVANVDEERLLAYAFIPCVLITHGQIRTGQLVGRYP